jgi:hypothetical protein
MLPQTLSIIKNITTLNPLLNFNRSIHCISDEMLREVDAG